MTIIPIDLARVELRQGRQVLVVADLFVAMEGDPLRDGRIVCDPEDPSRWAPKSLQHAADWINVRTRGGMESLVIHDGADHE